MKNWHSLRRYLMICTAVIFPRRSEAHFPHQKKRGQFYVWFCTLRVYLKIRRTKHHFLIDEEAAKVVRKIFYMYLEGYSRDGIAKKLNEEGIMTPSEYKRKVQGLKYSNAQEKAGAKRMGISNDQCDSEKPGLYRSHGTA